MSDSYDLEYNTDINYGNVGSITHKPIMSGRATCNCGYRKTEIGLNECLFSFSNILYLLLYV